MQNLQKVVNEYEEEGDASNVRQALAYYKKQLATEKEKNAELSLGLEDLERQLSESSKARKELEDNKILLKNEMTMLRSEVEKNRMIDSSDDSIFSNSRCLQGDL